MAYSNKHKIVLQAIMNEGALREEDGKQLIVKLFGHNNTIQVLNSINTKLRPLDMIIKCINCEVTGQLYWILVNTVQDVLISLHFEFSQAELALLRNIYGEIITSNNGCASSTWCLNLCSSLNLKLSKADAEQFLHNIVKNQWLCCKDGQYYMGVKSIAELFQYFKDTYEDNLHTCVLCKQIFFHGNRCQQCDATVHIHCLKTYAMNESNLKCSNCQHPIPNFDCSGDNIDSTPDMSGIISEMDETHIDQKKKLKKRRQI